MLAVAGDVGLLAELLVKGGRQRRDWIDVWVARTGNGGQRWWWLCLGVVGRCREGQASVLGG